MRPTLTPFVFAAVALAAQPVLAASSPVALSSWTVNSLDSSGRAINDHVEPDWIVSPDGTRVEQAGNARPSIYLAPEELQTTTVRGTLRVGASDDGDFLDDDFVGFVFGYEDGEINGPDADYWLIDWKQSGQTLRPGVDVASFQDRVYSFDQRKADRGLALSRVQGNFEDFSNELYFWSHTGVDVPTSQNADGGSAVEQVARGATLGDTGWEDFRTYRWYLEYTETSIYFEIDGVEQFNVTLPLGGTSALSAGDGSGFGFYALSQDEAFFTIAAVPVPASLPLLLAGFGGLALLRRRRG